MPTAGFWDLIALTGGGCDEEALRPLRRALRRASARRVEAFGADMVRALAAIGTPEHARQDVRDVSEPDGRALPMSDDVFLYVRCAVVGAGRDAWQRVVDDPAAMSGAWAVADGELLLSLVEELHDEKVGVAWTPDGQPAWAPGWLDWRGGNDVGVPWSAVHGWALSGLLEGLTEDPAWQEWWAASRRPRLEVNHFRTPEPAEGVTVRRRKDRVVVSLERDCAALHSDEVATLVAEAEAEVREPIEAVARALAMPPTPPWPQLPDVPDFADRVHEAEPSRADGIEVILHQGNIDADTAAAWLEAAAAEDPGIAERHRHG